MARKQDGEVTFTVPAATIRRAFADRAKRYEEEAARLEDTADRIAKAIQKDPENAAGRDPEPENGESYSTGGEVLVGSVQAMGLRTMAFKEQVRTTPKALRAKAVDLRRQAAIERSLSKMVTGRNFVLGESQTRCLFTR